MFKINLTENDLLILWGTTIIIKIKSFNKRKEPT